MACTRALQNQHRLFATKTQDKQLPKACAPSKTPGAGENNARAKGTQWAEDFLCIYDELEEEKNI